MQDELVFVTVNGTRALLQDDAWTLGRISAIFARLRDAGVGALLVLQGKEEIRDCIATGVSVEPAPLSDDTVARIITSPGCGDGAIVIRDGAIIAHSCLLPLSEARRPWHRWLGTRHLGAVGLSEATDATIFVLSGETGEGRAAYAASLWRLHFGEGETRLTLEQI